MKLAKNFPVFFILFFSLTLIMTTTACSSDDDNQNEIDQPIDGEDPTGDEDGIGCYIHLFDGDNFKGPNLKIDGPAEYANLDDLPNSDGRNWTDEADSFKIGEGATVTVWYQTNFGGDSFVYQPGEYASEEEPYSLKIECGE